MEYNWPTFVDDLEAGWLTSDVAKNDTKDNPVMWAEDAHNEAIAGNIWVDGDTLDQAYYDRATPLLTQQLGFAGLRLGAVPERRHQFLAVPSYTSHMCTGDSSDRQRRHAAIMSNSTCTRS